MCKLCHSTCASCSKSGIDKCTSCNNTYHLKPNESEYLTLNNSQIKDKMPLNGTCALCNQLTEFKFLLKSNLTNTNLTQNICLSCGNKWNGISNCRECIKDPSYSTDDSDDIPIKCLKCIPNFTLSVDQKTCN
jgi:hypothetical protein